MEKFTFINDELCTVKDALKKHANGLNSLTISRAFLNKDVKVNGHRIKDNVLLQVGDEVTIFYPNKKYYDVIYSDDNILVVNKLLPIETTDNTHSTLFSKTQDAQCKKNITQNKADCGIEKNVLLQTSREFMLNDNDSFYENLQSAEISNQQTLENEVRKIFKTARAVHRLDINTLGLICFALNDDAECELVNAFKNGDVVKKYSAIVYSGNVKQHEEFCDVLIKDEKNSRVCIKPLTKNQIINDTINTSIAKNEKHKSAHIAKLEYELINKKDDLAQILVTLHTGKTHQIRAQLSYHNIYILGDGKYGDKNLNRKYGKSYQQLKSVYLQFLIEGKLNYLSNMPFSIKDEF